MMRTIVMVVAVVLAGPSLADDAENFRNLAERCGQVRNSLEDSFQVRALARPLADELEGLAQKANGGGFLLDLLPEMNEAAAECIAYARQMTGGVAFDPERNRYVSIGLIRAQEEALRQIEEEQKAAVAAAEASVMESLRRERQEALEREVNLRVLSACTTLAADDPVSAYTNALCVQSFKANGLPEQ